MDEAARERRLHIVRAESPSEMLIVNERLGKLQEAAHSRGREEGRERVSACIGELCEAPTYEILSLS